GDTPKGNGSPAGRWPLLPAVRGPTGRAENRDHATTLWHTHSIRITREPWSCGRVEVGWRRRRPGPMWYAATGRPPFRPRPGAGPTEAAIRYVRLAPTAIPKLAEAKTGDASGLGTASSSKGATGACSNSTVG